MGYIAANEASQIILKKTKHAFKLLNFISLVWTEMIMLNISKYTITVVLLHQKSVQMQ